MDPLGTESRCIGSAGFSLCSYVIPGSRQTKLHPCQGGFYQDPTEGVACIVKVLQAPEKFRLPYEVGINGVLG